MPGQGVHAGADRGQKSTRAILNQHRMGLLSGLAGYSLLTLGDAVVKSMAGAWPGTAVTALRFLIGAVGIGLIIALTQGRAGFVVPRPRLQMARGAALATASLCFYLSLFVMPLAEATAISFAAPIVIALLSAWWFSEHVPRISWLAMLLATAGVLTVLRPNVALFGWSALLPVAAMLAMSIFVMLNRISAQDVTPMASQFWVAVYATPLQAVVVAVAHASGEASFVIMHAPDWTVIVRCAIVALTASSAHMLLFMATRRVSPATMAPTSYIQIVMAMALGIMVFSDLPDVAALAGTGLIVAAGLILWYANGTKRADGEELTP